MRNLQLNGPKFVSLALLLIGVSMSAFGQGLTLQKPIGEYDLVPEYTIRTDFESTGFIPEKMSISEPVPNIMLTEKKPRKKRRKVTLDINGEETKQRIRTK